jgi:hypothetical protein
MGEEYLEEEDAGDTRGVNARNCSLSSAIRGVGARSIEELEVATEVGSGCRIKGTAIKVSLHEVSTRVQAKVMDLQGFPASESNWSGSQKSGRPGKEISWPQDEPLGVETCPSLISSGSVDRRTSMGEWSRTENLRYVLGSNPCFFRWVLKEDDRRILSNQSRYRGHGKQDMIYLDGQPRTGHLKGSLGRWISLRWRAQDEGSPKVARHPANSHLNGFKPVLEDLS